MTDAPETIWAWRYVDYDTDKPEDSGEWYTECVGLDGDEVSYTRTDIAQARLAKAMVVLKLISGADWEARLGEAIDISCEILAENMGDEE